MKASAIIAFSIALVLGCRSTGTVSAEDKALRAKAALLTLMRSDASVFTGARADRFEQINVVKTGSHEFSWGAFTTDTARNRYAASVDMVDSVQFFNGRFTVDPDGGWKAGMPRYSRALKMRCEWQ